MPLLRCRALLARLGVLECSLPKQVFSPLISVVAGLGTAALIYAARSRVRYTGVAVLHPYFLAAFELASIYACSYILFVILCLVTL